MFVVIVETSRPFSARPRLVKHAEVGVAFAWLRFVIRFFSLLLDPDAMTTVYVDATGKEENTRVEKVKLSQQASNE